MVRKFDVVEIGRNQIHAGLDKGTLMRRLTLTFLAFIFAASACFGASGSWRCANGTPCAFTPGVGFHCPDVKPASIPPSAAQPMGSSCSHCRPPTTSQVKTASAPGPCASVCRGCQCEFKVTSLRVPATTSQTPNLPVFQFADHPIAFPSNAVPTIGFTTRPIIFTTGPPDLLPAALHLTTPSRAPPRLLSA
jgi:hypothetical protein